MAERKSYLLRLPADLWDQIQRSAAADLRSVNAQIELLLRESLRQRGRVDSINAIQSLDPSDELNDGT